MSRGAMARALRARGVQHVFGVPGTQIANLVTTLGDEGIRFVLAAHEGGAAFMANGYARVSGRPGVVLTIGGPGFTNALTGIAEARLDTVPVVHLVNASPRGPGAAFRLQSVDHAAIAAPLAKGCFTVTREEDADAVLARAFGLAQGGEPGPVLVEMGGGEASDDGEQGTGSTRSSAAPAAPAAPAVPERPDGLERPAVPERPDAAEVDRLRDLWREARRPLLYLGQGALDVPEALQDVVDQLRIPVIATPTARGVIPEDHPMALGFDVLRGGVGAANELLAEADLILALGCRFAHNGTAGFQLRFPEAALVHVNREPSVLNACYPATLALTLDTREVAAILLETPRPAASWDPESLRQARQALITPAPDPAEPRIHRGTPRPAAEFMAWFRDALPRDAVLATDSGQHQIMIRRHFPVLSPRGLVIPSDLQSMGFGVPAAIGAKLAAPYRPVVAAVGDGGFLMSGMEVATAVREKLPVVFAVFNDGHLGQIRLQQLKALGATVGVELAPMAFEVFAYAMGIRYLRHDEELDVEAITEALAADGPTLLEIPVGDAAALPRIADRARLRKLAADILPEKGRRTLKRLLGR